MNHYETLGVDKSADLDTIRKAYRQLAKKYHPDVNHDPEAIEMFKKVGAAYEVLSDPEKRVEYDTYGDQSPEDFWKGAQRRRPPFTSGFSDFFNGFFGNRKKQAVGEHIIIDCQMELKDVMQNTQKVLSYMRNKPCEDCQGTGGVVSKCKDCDGKGTRIVTGANLTVQTTCETCRGTGDIIEQACQSCGGSGLGQAEEKKIEVTIPAGVETGMRFKYPGMGHPSPHGRPGDLYVTAYVKPDSLFQRLERGGVSIQYPATYTQLIFGDKVDVPTLHGVVSFKIPEGTQPNSVFRMAGQGLPIFNSGDTTYSNGDQFVEVVLVVPKKVKGKHRSLLEELREIETTQEIPERKEFSEKLGDRNGPEE